MRGGGVGFPSRFLRVVLPFCEHSDALRSFRSELRSAFRSRAPLPAPVSGDSHLFFPGRRIPCPPTPFEAGCLPPFIRGKRLIREQSGDGAAGRRARETPATHQKKSREQKLASHEGFGFSSREGSASIGSLPAARRSRREKAEEPARPRAAKTSPQAEKADRRASAGKGWRRFRATRHTAHPRRLPVEGAAPQSLAAGSPPRALKNLRLPAFRKAREGSAAAAAAAHVPRQAVFCAEVELDGGRLLLKSQPRGRSYDRGEKKKTPPDRR